MATTDWHSSTERAAAVGVGEDTAPQSSDLKSLLNTIVHQLTDADRRHSDTLQQMQDRLEAMGREANSMRARVPEAFQPAFERIEAGMSELAARIADSGRARGAVEVFDDAEAKPAATLQATKKMSEPVHHSSPVRGADGPLALRSAAGGTPAPQHRDARIDTFDVIESGLAVSEADQWDRGAADALIGLYNPVAAPPQQSLQPLRVADPAPASPSIDKNWLEQKFSEIAKRVEESLADARPDEAFFALGQRLETVERHVARVADTAVTRADVEGIALIEAHVAELTNHLQSAHNQLSRLDGIESMLTEVSSRLAEVHEVALASDSSPVETNSAPQLEESLRAVARAAVEEATSAFAKLSSPPAAENSDELRPLIERLLSDSRVGEENTAALLDTMQQAMIRLLDRIDAMELAQQQAVEAQAVFVERAVRAVQDAHQAQRETAQAQRPYAKQLVADDAQALTSMALDARVDPSVAADEDASDGYPAESIYAPRENARLGGESNARTSDQVRQDFIADLRRAKMRLASDDGENSNLKPEQSDPDAVTAGASSPVAASRATLKVGAAAPRLDARPTSASRLVATALASFAAIAGLWYALASANTTPIVNAKSALEKSDAAPAAASLAGGADVVGEPDKDVGLPSDGGSNSILPEGTRSEITPDEMVVGQTSVPMLGIAVDTEAPVTAVELERAKRRQTMAALSTKLGHAAAELSASTPTPASLIPEDPAKTPSANAMTAIAKGGLSSSSPLDLPPASVGPLSLRLAAANGDPSAEFDVGARLAEGKGSANNFKEAAKWYQRSADKGFAQAQYRLGTLYERGLGLKTDPARAQVWYLKAAEAGNIKAMHNLAVMSANQSGASPDYESASRWFTQASERGLADSQFNLAVLYENGLGVEKDLQQAFKWLSLAARSGDTEAVRRRDILKGKLTLSEISEAEAMVNKWRSQKTDALTNDARTAAEAWKKNPQNGVNG